MTICDHWKFQQIGHHLKFVSVRNKLKRDQRTIPLIHIVDIINFNVLGFSFKLTKGENKKEVLHSWLVFAHKDGMYESPIQYDSSDGLDEFIISPNAHGEIEKLF